MTRFLRISLASAGVLLVLVACGESSVLRARRGGSVVSFEAVETTRTISTPLTLSTCGQNDPQPQSIDDEVRVCVHLQLDAARLAEAPLGQPLPLAGSVEVPPQGEGSPTFTPEGEHTALVRAGWASALCYSPERTTAVVQQVRGQLVLTRREATRLVGRLTVTVEGAAAHGDCGIEGPFETEAAFDVPVGEPVALRR